MTSAFNNNNAAGTAAAAPPPPPSAFQTRRAELLVSISSSLENVLQQVNQLNRTLEGIIEIGNEFGGVEALWSQFESVMGRTNNTTPGSGQDQDQDQEDETIADRTVTDTEVEVDPDASTSEDRWDESKFGGEEEEDYDEDAEPTVRLKPGRNKQR